jgi:putative transposase
LTLLSRNNFVYEAKLLRVKLNNRKIQWLIQEKLRGRGSGELALIQKVTRRRVEQLWQTYRKTGAMPTLKKPGRPRSIRDLKEAAIILEAYNQHRLGAVNLERIINVKLGVHIPHNRIHEALRMNGKATQQPSKQQRRTWVRYEREHSMSLWHMDWKQLSTGEWILAILDDASRYIVGYGVFREATALNTLQVLKEAIQHYGKPDEILTDRGSQFYANEGERKEKGGKPIRSLPSRPRNQTYPLPCQPSPDEWETGTLLRSPRRQDDSSSPNSHNPRIYSLAQRGQTTHEPQLGKLGNTHSSIPEETTPR